MEENFIKYCPDNIADVENILVDTRNILGKWIENGIPYELISISIIQEFLCGLVEKCETPEEFKETFTKIMKVAFEALG